MQTAMPLKPSLDPLPVFLSLPRYLSSPAPNVDQLHHSSATIPASCEKSYPRLPSTFSGECGKGGDGREGARALTLSLRANSYNFRVYKHMCEVLTHICTLYFIFFATFRFNMLVIENKSKKNNLSQDIVTQVSDNYF